VWARSGQLIAPSAGKRSSSELGPHVPRRLEATIMEISLSQLALWQKMLIGYLVVG
jgi:hypothetical protein